MIGRVRRGPACGAIVAVVALAALAAAPARAADECEGLLVCIPVVGPWVVVPPSQASSSSATWRLACPEGVVGGTDARVSVRTVGVTFAARVGAPVAPGISTSDAALFTGRYSGAARGTATSFQPFIGCVPASGGGRRTPTSGSPREPVATAAASPLRPVERVTVRTRTFNVETRQLARGTVRCRSGERLLRSSHAIGLRTPGPPSAAQLASVRVVRAGRGGTVVASATRSGLDRTIRAEVQLRAECGR